MASQSDDVYVFDLDGVITNPENSKVSEAVVDAMYALLADGTYVAVNTGRSYDWVEQSLVSRFEARNNNEIFSRFIIVCEKGGETVSWQGSHLSIEPSDFALPKNIYDITQSTYEQNKKQLQTMFWDDTKRTMATIEKLPSADLKIFHTEQILLVEKLQVELTGYDVRIDHTTIATDVELSAAGKYAGAKLIHQWISLIKGSVNHSFISIGDSPTDYDMARYFAEQQASSTFVYVGKPTGKISHDKRVTFVTTQNHYAAGALEFLNS